MKVTDKDYYMDGYLKNNLDLLMKAVKKNWDGVIMVDGVEGSAKSTLAAAIGYYLDPNYSLQNVVFNQDQFFKAVDNAKPLTVIHWDEFVLGGLSTEAMNSLQNALIKKITTIRKKQLFIILVMPWFFMMRPYFAIGRSRCLIHCYSHDGISRGRFKFYSYVKKQSLYHQGKKFYSYHVKPDFYGTFTDTFGLFWDQDEYDKKKEKAIVELTDKPDKRESRYKKVLSLALKEIREECHYEWKQMSKVLKTPESTIRRWATTTEESSM